MKDACCSFLVVERWTLDVESLVPQMIPMLMSRRRVVVTVGIVVDSVQQRISHEDRSRAGGEGGAFERAGDVSRKLRRLAGPVIPAEARCVGGQVVQLEFLFTRNRKNS